MYLIRPFSYYFLLLCTVICASGCQTELEDLEPAEFPSNGDVFLDGFSAGLEYGAFGGSDVTAFDTDSETTYSGREAMVFRIPDNGSANGGYAGGAFFTGSGRNLTGYNALTFWAKATRAANLDVIGFGNDFGDARYQASSSGLAMTTNWQKYYIPIPDPSKLTRERGMLFYSEAPEAGRGYTFWLDEVQFEDVPDLGDGRGVLYGGRDTVISAQPGDTYNLQIYSEFNLPSGINQQVTTAPAYFDFTSSDSSIAVVSESGTVTVRDTGTAVITATLAGDMAAGSLTINSGGTNSRPRQAAPTPDIPADRVISLFSDAYEDEPVDFYNGFWLDSDTQSEIISIAGNEVIRYSQLNFVGIQFTDPVIDITNMTHLRMDVWTPDPTEAPNGFKVKLFDVGADAAFGTGDDSEFELSFSQPILRTGEWITLDIPLSSFTGVAGRNLAQVVLSASPDEARTNVYIDNLFFYNSGNGGGGGGDSDDEPTLAAPTPTRAASDVISLFSDAYEDVPVATWRTDWSTATLTDTDIDGNAVKKYTDANVIGVEASSPIDASAMTHVHLDVWTPNATLFAIKLVDFGADGGFDGGDDVEQQLDFPNPAQGQWIAYDIPLSDFTNLTTQASLAQFIFVGQPEGTTTLFLDNVYLYDANGSGGGGNADEPTMAAPTPTRDAANVISLFSDAYTDVPVATWRTDWSTATLTDTDIGGNAVKKYTDANVIGVETSNPVDASGMTHIHMDVWTPNATLFAVKLVDFGADGAFDGGDDVEQQLDFADPAQGQWIPYDIPLSEFTDLTTRSNLAQFIFVGQPEGTSTLYLDNIYFYQE